MASTALAAAAEPVWAGNGRYDLVHADALNHLPELVKEHGADLSEVSRAAGLDPALIGRPGFRLDYRFFVELLNVAAEQTGQPDFGLQLAARQRGGRVIGPIGVVMKNSRTVGQALGYCAKHIHAYSRATKVRFRPERDNQRLVVTLDVLLDRVCDTRQALEHAIALASYNIMDISGGAVRPRRIFFRHAPLLALRLYARAFGCEVLFEQEHDGFVLTEADLLCAVSDADEQIYEMATSFIDQRFPPEAPPLHTRVRSLILQWLASEDCTSDRVAAHLCLHPRTLQRRLRAEGRSFDGIREEVRRELALQYLQHADMPLTLVAEKLGYAETSVLSRSCYRWFKISPRQLRQRGLAAAD